MRKKQPDRKKRERWKYIEFMKEEIAKAVRKTGREGTIEERKRVENEDREAELRTVVNCMHM